ncbi:hypothetical protein [Cocleimonas flava]|uniref:Uncharacterized protein n=1 Tax=Cocleimonas flava TaxID=634765 RepID=A0A4R1F801_9GAMM|nr:hypothetical protein [Cocleimonas flava]TCJ88804.1 hypothetical protein EV695_0663 [Cocleimonas flava]
MKNVKLKLARTLSVLALSFAGVAFADKSTQYSELLQNGVSKTTETDKASQYSDRVDFGPGNRTTTNQASQTSVGSSLSMSAKKANVNVAETTVDKTAVKNTLEKTQKLNLELQ